MFIYEKHNSFKIIELQAKTLNVYADKKIKCRLVMNYEVK